MKLPEVLTKLMAKEITGARTVAWKPGSVLGLNEGGEVSISFNGGKTWRSWTPYPSDFKAEFTEVKLAKQKKVVRMAPALVEYNKGHYCITETMFATNTEAEIINKPHFRRWLIDTPYAIDVEVEV